MIHPNAEPIAHVSPYKRIELGAKPKRPEPKWVPVVISPIEDIYGWVDPKSLHPFY